VILLDTQIVVWLSREQHRLSKVAAEALTNARREGVALAVADISLWEIAMGVSKRRITLGVSLQAALEQISRLYNVLPISPEIALRSMTLFLKSHSDPADRLIAATALVHGLPLVTADSRILASGEVPCIW
jgi:PIN domain nuclease of toxin-antitoxin system